MAATGESFSGQFMPDLESEAYAQCAEHRVMAEIDRLGLRTKVDDLERDGFTVLSPEEVGPPEFAQALCARTIEVSQARTAKPFDLAGGSSHADLESPFGQVQFEPCLLEEDPIFEKALMHQRALALITYLLGESCVLCHFSAMVKGPGADHLPLHADQNQNGAPPPFPRFAQVANATWALTDYTIGNGCICFVPGSHRYCRPPSHDEATDLSMFVPLEVPAGSVIVWHGNTWHGAFRRTNPGLRVNLVAYFNRWYHFPIEDLRSRISEEMLARNPDRFAVLTGVRHPALRDPLSAAVRAMRTSLFA